MQPSEFSRKVQELRSRLDALRGEEMSREPDGVVLGPEKPLIEILSDAIEEISVADEELGRQSRVLAASQDALEAERRRYQDLFEFAPHGYLVTDLYGVIREANRAAADLFEIDPSFLVGKPIAAFVLTDDRLRFRSELRAIAESPGTRRFEIRVQSRSGTILHTTTSVSSILDPFHKPHSLRWALHDRSELKRAETALRELNAGLERRVVARTAQLQTELRSSESLLIDTHARYASDGSGRTFVELVDDLDAIIWTADPATGKLTFVSRRAEATLGYPVDRWLHDPLFWTDRIHPEDREWVLQNRERFAREGRSHEAEYRIIAADGRSVWFRESVRVYKPDGITPTELRGLMVNITKRKKVERQLYSAKNDLLARLDDATYLLELNVRLNASLNLSPLLEEVLSGVVAVLGAEGGVICLHDPASGNQRIFASVNLDLDHADRTIRIPDGFGPIGAALSERASVLVEDMTTDPLISSSMLAIVRRLKVQAVFSAPLLNRDRVALGTVSAVFSHPHRPSERQIRLVERFASHAADVIENARRHEALREDGDRRGDSLRCLTQQIRPPLQALHEVANLPDLPDAARTRIASEVDRLSRIFEDLLDAVRKPDLEADGEDNSSVLPFDLTG